MSKSTRSPIQLPLPIEGATIEIPLTKGYTTIIDAVDSDLLAYKWCVVLPHNRPYAIRNVLFETGKRGMILLHRVILERKIGRPLDDTEVTDHRNMNTLNNQRVNLRIASEADNHRNTRIRSHNTSGYKGVHFFKRDNNWRASITINGKSKHLGYFDTPEQAYAAYCEAAIQYFGEFARFD